MEGSPQPGVVEHLAALGAPIAANVEILSGALDHFLVAVVRLVPIVSWHENRVAPLVRAAQTNSPRLSKASLQEPKEGRPDTSQLLPSR